MDAPGMNSYLLGMLIGMLVTCVGGVLLGGLLLKAMTNVIAKFSPPYLRCCLAILVAMLGSFAVYIALSIAGVSIAELDGQLTAPDSYGAVAGVMLVVLGLSLVSGFALTVAVLNWLILRPDGGRLGIAVASLITLALLVLAIVMLLALTVGLATMIGVMPPV